jgi:DnaJ-class molecular chaperone
MSNPANVNNFYERLGVARCASASEIRSAYRKLALEWHPDVRGNSPETIQVMAALNVAYETLCDSSTRARYDRLLDNPAASRPVQERQNPFAGMDINDIVEDLLRRMRARAQERSARKERPNFRSSNFDSREFYEKNSFKFNGDKSNYYYKAKDCREYSDYADLNRANKAWNQENLTFICNICHQHVPIGKWGEHIAFCKISRRNSSKDFKAF